MGCSGGGTLLGKAGRYLGVRGGSVIVNWGSEIWTILMRRDRRVGRSDGRRGKAVAAGVGEGALDVGDVPGAAVVDGTESDRRQQEGEKRRLSTGG